MSVMSSALTDILSLTERQAEALIELLPQIKKQAGIFHGLHLYMRVEDAVLRIGSDGWPGEWRISDDGSVEDDTE